MAEAGSWEKIRRDGLLSTTALLDLYDVPRAARFPIEAARRGSCVTLTHPCTQETATVRDNGPLIEKFLAGCLIDMTCEAWYRHLNRRVFFWVREEKLRVLLNARAYRNRPHDVIIIDARRLVERELENVTLAPINTGAAFAPNAARRGSQPFTSIARYPYDEHLRWRGPADAITELAVEYRLGDVEQLALRVERRWRGDVIAILWPAS